MDYLRCLKGLIITLIDDHNFSLQAKFSFWVSTSSTSELFLKYASALVGRLVLVHVWTRVDLNIVAPLQVGLPSWCFSLCLQFVVFPSFLSLVLSFFVFSMSVWFSFLLASQGIFLVVISHLSFSMSSYLFLLATHCRV